MPSGRNRFLIASLVSLVVWGAAAASAAAFQSSREDGCSEWHECRQLAVAAAARGEYERFHDLAWRAVQTGPRNDHALMYLLARAQSLSGRPHDALVMLQRLADVGAAPAEALTSEDFARARQLPGWAGFAAHLASAAPANSNAPAAEPAAPAVPSTPPNDTAVMPSPLSASLALQLRPVEALRFANAPFSLAGLAYDAVSQRFLFGDRQGRKLIVVGERSDHSVDLARADSSGFQEIAALSIDARRGDLWVTSAGAGDGTATLHKLQLISGRTLKAFQIDPDGMPVRPVDLAIDPTGTVVVLDAGASRLLVLRPGHTALDATPLDLADPVSVALGDDDGVAYVAHGGAIARVNLRAAGTTSLALPRSTSFEQIESVRWHRRALIVIDVESSGGRRITRLALNERGTAVTKSTTLADDLPGGSGQAFVDISGDDLVFMRTGSGATSPAGLEEFVAYRLRLK